MKSVWSETADKKTHPALDRDVTTDVLIIGGGMSGILIAHKLKETGIHCVVAEAKTVGCGITKNTTAKITAQHGLIYADLINKFGKEKAQQYYEVNMKSIQHFHILADQFHCDFENKTAYVYSTNNRQKLENEANAYLKLGIPSQIDDNSPIPIKTKGALAMENQAQFHPLKLLYALSDRLIIYENTFISKIKGLTAYSESGKITAKHIVLATHYPLINIPGLYFVKLYQHRSYVLALEGAQLIDGMYLDEREKGHSFRTYGKLLFIGGGDHRTGKKGGGYAELRAFVENNYPHATEKYHWATQDCMTLDNIPYIGRHRTGAKELYVATGFNKWGMTGSMAAAELITDLIVTGKSEWEELYTPKRSVMHRQIVINLGTAAKGFLSIGKPRCSHMGCKLHRNISESTWDCSCHGSRFDESGNVTDNPAKKGIRL